MTHHYVTCLDDQESLCLAAADEFVHAYVRAVECRGLFRVALAGGTTPRRLHRILSESPIREKISWDQVEFYFGDERCVTPDHPDSNFRMARDTLFQELGIEDSKIHRMGAEQVDLDWAARGYEEQMAEAFQIQAGGPAPNFDLIFLGMGADGHTASLFPETRALREQERWVVGNEVPKLSCSRMTFTYPLINAAHRVVFTIAGEAKAEALAAVLEGPPNLSRYPSQGIQPNPGSVIFLIDRAASAGLAPKTMQDSQGQR